LLQYLENVCQLSTSKQLYFTDSRNSEPKQTSSVANLFKHSARLFTQIMSTFREAQASRLPRLQNEVGILMHLSARLR
jgi:hypothetical protein